jgi:hypothetical protein
MNLAVSSILILLILSPAIIARRIYFARGLSKSSSLRNTIQEVFASVFTAFILHTLGCWMASLLGKGLDIAVVAKLLFAPQELKDYAPISTHANLIALYFILLSIGAALIAWLLRQMVRQWWLDRRWDFLRYDNTWKYLFSGEVFDITKYNPDTAFRSTDLELLVLDVLTKSGEKGYLYRGVFVDYSLNDANTVEFIVLGNPDRQVIGVPDEPKQIESDFFLIPFSEVQNINFRYFLRQDEKGAEA